MSDNYDLYDTTYCSYTNHSSLNNFSHQILLLIILLFHLFFFLWVGWGGVCVLWSKQIKMDVEDSYGQLLTSLQVDAQY